MINILVAGDFGVRHRTLESVNNNDFEEPFSEVKAVVEKSDYAIVNFEMPIVETQAIPIPKCGPNLKCPSASLKAVSYIGFNCLTLANNHFYDFGELGVNNTIHEIEEAKFDYVGGGSNELAAARVLYKQVKNKEFAFINCCEEEFSIATKTTGGSNHFDPVRLYYCIKEARKNADYVIVIVHGGHEHFQLPSIRMQETYRFIVDVGADAVINHHQHCFSGFEYYHDRPIVYGLGNFCFDRPDKRGCIWNEGYMAQLFFSDKIELAIIPYIQNDERPGVFLKPELQEKVKQLNRIITDRELLEKEIDKYYHSMTPAIAGIFEPIQNKFLKALQNRRLFPSLVSKKWLLQMQNFILCESHRDRLRDYFKTK